MTTESAREAEENEKKQHASEEPGREPEESLPGTR